MNWPVTVIWVEYAENYTEILWPRKLHRLNCITKIFIINPASQSKYLSVQGLSFLLTTFFICKKYIWTGYTRRPNSNFISIFVICLGIILQCIMAFFVLFSFKCLWFEDELPNILLIFTLQSCLNAKVFTTEADQKLPSISKEALILSRSERSCQKVFQL